MAGKAKWALIRDALQRRTNEHFQIVPDQESEHTILSYVEDWIANGQFFIDLCKEIADEIDAPVWHSSVERWLKVEFGPEAVTTAMRTSRVRASPYIAEQSVALVDAAGETSAEVSKAGAQARSRQWLAEKFSPEAFGSRSGTSVVINVSQLHLDSLRTVVSPPKEVTDITSGSQIALAALTSSLP